MKKSKAYILAFTILTAAAWAGPAPGLSAAADVLANVQAGNIDAAAQSVSSANRATQGSLAWYHESTLVLLGWAEELKAAGESDAAREVAAAAIQMMGRGITKGAATAGIPDRAHLYVQLATAYDRFFGDRTSARHYYELALQLEPNLASAKAALGAHDAEAARQQQLAGGN